MPVDIPSFNPERLFPIGLRSMSALSELAYHNYRFLESNSLLTRGKKIQETRQKKEAGICSGRSMKREDSSFG
jgi:hypothetical protein